MIFSSELRCRLGRRLSLRKAELVARIERQRNPGIGSDVTPDVVQILQAIEDCFRVTEDIASRSGRPSLQHLGIVVALMSVALNAWLFANARSFELGETMGVFCGEFRRLGLIEPVTLLLIIQIAVFMPLILLWRTWLWLGLSVVPYWLVLYGLLCVPPS